MTSNPAIALRLQSNALVGRVAELGSLTSQMLFSHSTFVKGEPFGKPYRGKRPAAPGQWLAAIKAATSEWPIVRDACLLRVTFLLPTDKFADTNFFGPDLDNLMGLFLDGLKQTVFRSPSDDSFVVSMEVTKTRVEDSGRAGAMLEIIPLQTLTRRNEV